MQGELCRAALESAGCLHEITRKKFQSCVNRSSACLVASLIRFKLLVHILHSLSRNSPVRFILAREFLATWGRCLWDSQYPFVQDRRLRGMGEPWSTCGPWGYHITNLILQQQPNGLFIGAYRFCMVQKVMGPRWNIQGVRPRRAQPWKQQSSGSRKLHCD